MSFEDTHWTRDVLGHLLTQLQDESQPIAAGTLRFGPAVSLSISLFRAELLQCGTEYVQQLCDAAKDLLQGPDSTNAACAQLDVLTEVAYQQMSRTYQKVAPVCWRRLYTDTCIIRTLGDMLASEHPKTDSALKAAIARLDRAIIIAGACGEGRLALIQILIAEIQSSVAERDHSSRDLPPYLTERQITLPETFTASVPRLDPPPSFSTFISRMCSHPFVLPGFIRDWPALTDHPWRSLEYLRKVTGPGRLVPVEVGSDYRSDDWTQKMMDMDEFLDALSSFAHGNSSGSPILYLAQHSIFLQFPALRDDVIIPDYLYASLPAPDNYPQYQPPRTEEQLVMNAWLGPAGTVSPAHTVGIRSTYMSRLTNILLLRTLSTTSTVSS